MEDYTVRWPFVLEVIQGFGVEPTLDCFAAQGNERCNLYFTKEDNSLAQEWPENEVLWLNPPGPCGTRLAINC